MTRLAVGTRIVVAALMISAANAAEQGMGSVMPEQLEVLAGHLQIGTRITSFTLLDDTSDSFVGSVDKLNESQDYMPVRVYADWLFTPYVGVDLTWDRVEAETVTEEKVDTPSHSDGTFKINGPIISIIGRYPNPTAFIPYGGAGVALMSAGFEPATWWYTGFPSETDWVDNGSPAMTLNGLNRIIEVDDTVGYMAFGGCDYKITDNVFMDAYFRYMKVEVDAHYFLTINGELIEDQGWYSIPLHNVAVGLGVSYLF